CEPGRRGRLLGKCPIGPLRSWRVCYWGPGQVLCGVVPTDPEGRERGRCRRLPFYVSPCGGERLRPVCGDAPIASLQKCAENAEGQWHRWQSLLAGPNRPAN